jgi:hypothetical protein
MKNIFHTCLFLLAAITYTCAHAVVINVIPADDRTISDFDSDGVADGLAEQEALLRTGFTNINTRYWRSALEFNISSVLNGSSVSSATLLLSDAGSTQIGKINVWGYNGNGIIEINDGNFTLNLLATLTITSSTGNPEFSINVTSFIQNLSDLSVSYAGFLLGGINGGASDICSVEADPVAYGCGIPLLNIEFTPPPRIEITAGPGNTSTVMNIIEPPSIALFLLGLVCLTAMRRKQQTTLIH